MIEKKLPNGNTTYINPDFEKILDGREKPPVPEAPAAGFIPPDEEEIARQFLRVKAWDAKQYLEKTDWYAQRKAETGKAIPDDVLEKRAQARIDASYSE